MDQLIQELVSKVGLTQAQAQQVLQIVQGFLKDKLPPEMMGQLSGALGSMGDAAGAAAGTAAETGGGMMDSVKGALGR